MCGVRVVRSCVPFLGQKHTLCGVGSLGRIRSLGSLGRFIRREKPAPPTNKSHPPMRGLWTRGTPTKGTRNYHQPPPHPKNATTKARVVDARNSNERRAELPPTPANPAKSRGMRGVRSKCGGRKRNFLWLSLLRFAKNLYICTIVHIYIRYKILKI